MIVQQLRALWSEQQQQKLGSPASPFPESCAFSCLEPAPFSSLFSFSRRRRPFFSSAASLESHKLRCVVDVAAAARLGVCLLQRTSSFPSVPRADGKPVQEPASYWSEEREIVRADSETTSNLLRRAAVGLLFLYLRSSLYLRPARLCSAQSCKVSLDCARRCRKRGAGSSETYTAGSSVTKGAAHVDILDATRSGLAPEL